MHAWKRDCGREWCTRFLKRNNPRDVSRQRIFQCIIFTDILLFRFFFYFFITIIKNLHM